MTRSMTGADMKTPSIKGLGEWPSLQLQEVHGMAEVDDTIDNEIFGDTQRALPVFDQNDFIREFNGGSLCITAYRYNDFNKAMVGYVLYRRTGPSTIEISRIAVSPLHRGRGYGTGLIRGVVEIAFKNDCKVRVAPSDRLNMFHCFLRKNGFKAKSVINNGTDNCKYVFDCKMPKCSGV